MGNSTSTRNQSKQPIVQNQDDQKSQPYILKNTNEQNQQNDQDRQIEVVNKELNKEQENLEELLNEANQNFEDLFKEMNILENQLTDICQDLNKQLGQKQIK